MEAVKGHTKIMVFCKCPNCLEELSLGDMQEAQAAVFDAAPIECENCGAEFLLKEITENG